MNSVSLDETISAKLKDLQPGDPFSICVKGTVKSNDGGFEGDVTEAEPMDMEEETGPGEGEAPAPGGKPMHKNPAIAIIMGKH